MNVFNNVQLVQLDQTTNGELEKIIKQCPPKTCCLDSTLTDLLRQSAAIHLPCLVALVNASFQHRIFPKTLRTASVIPLLKKETLHVD